MLKGKIKDYFVISGGNSGLTEEVIYKNQPKDIKDNIMVLSGATISSNDLKNISENAKIIDKKGNEKSIKVYSGEGLKIVRKGRAGFTTYVNEKKITINDDAYFMQVKPKYKELINIIYIEYVFKEIIENCVSSDKNGNRTFGKTLFEETFVEIEHIEIQKKVANEILKLIKQKTDLEKKLYKIENLFSHIVFTDGEYKRIKEVFYIKNGERISERLAYLNQGNIPVATAQTVNNGVTYEANINWLRTLKDEGLINEPCITWTKDGAKAGTLFYRDYIFYASDLCGVLIPKEEYKDKINLKWFLYTQKANIDKQITSKSTQCKIYNTSMSNVEFQLPDIETQHLIANEYEKLNEIKKKIEVFIEKIEKLLK